MASTSKSELTKPTASSLENIELLSQIYKKDAGKIPGETLYNHANLIRKVDLTKASDYDKSIVRDYLTTITAIEADK